MLPKPACYVPLDKGIYEVAPGLFSLGHDFGQGDVDSKVFQIDSEFSRFRTNVEACRKENLSKYYCVHNLPKNIEQRAVRFFCEQLAVEWPQFFKHIKTAHGSRLECAITGESLSFNSDYELASASKYVSGYVSGLDALRSQVQEDFAITVDTGSSDYLGMLHVCCPTHWAPEQKVGKTFFDVHAIVPGIEKMAKASRSLVNAMIHKGPYVRFVWSFVTDKNLNHHPVPPKGEDPAKWKGRSFHQTAAMPFYLRVERQITFGLPEVNAGLFFIRVSFVDGTAIKANEIWRKKLITSLESMSPESRRYKGVEPCFSELIDWLT
jgi:dimethylamine monooxygenase subunit A